MNLDRRGSDGVSVASQDPRSEVERARDEASGDEDSDERAPAPTTADVEADEAADAEMSALVAKLLEDFKQHTEEMAREEEAGLSEEQVLLARKYLRCLVLETHAALTHRSRSQIPCQSESLH